MVNEPLTPEKIRQAQMLGWCVEIVSKFNPFVNERICSIQKMENKKKLFSLNENLATFQKNYLSPANFSFIHLLQNTSNGMHLVKNSVKFYVDQILIAQ